MRFLIAIMLTVCAGCGQSGDLYLPDEPERPAAADASPTDEAERDGDTP